MEVESPAQKLLYNVIIMLMIRTDPDEIMHALNITEEMKRTLIQVYQKAMEKGKDEALEALVSLSKKYEKEFDNG